MSDYRSDGARDLGDFGETDLDPVEQSEADINLDDPTDGDDEPWSPPTRQPRGAELIGEEEGEGETLGQRLAQEVPDEEPLDPDNAETVGGDDPDAIPADQDVLGGEAGGDTPVDGASPEESAMRLVDDPEADPETPAG